MVTATYVRHPVLKSYLTFAFGKNIAWRFRVHLAKVMLEAFVVV